MTELYSYTGKILRIDLSSRKVRKESLNHDIARKYIGGRGLNSERVYREIPSGIDPLGPENKLMIATGPLVGTMFPTASRFNVSAKSPQTGIFGDSNAGGHFAPEMKFAGYDQIIIEGMAEDSSYIFIKDEDVQIRSSSQMVYDTVFEADRKIKNDLNDPMVINKGDTVDIAAEAVHKDFRSKLKYAIVWGSGVYDGQRVSRKHVLKDGDIIEFHI